MLLHHARRHARFDGGDVVLVGIHTRGVPLADRVADLSGEVQELDGQAELAQLGVVEFVFSDYAWISSFVPQAQVLALNYLFPTERVPEVIDWMVKNGEFFPLLEKAFRKHRLDYNNLSKSDEMVKVAADFGFKALDDLIARYPSPSAEQATLIADLKAESKTVDHNAGAHLLDMGDGVCLLEFHTYKGMNPVDADIIMMMMQCVEEVQKRGFLGVVVGSTVGYVAEMVHASILADLLQG